METTFERNKKILKDVLSGLDSEACAEKYKITKPAVNVAIRNVLATMKEYTGYDSYISGAMDFLKENKETILKYIDEPMPKVPLTSYAKEILNEEFGPCYPSIPDKVAAQWDTIKKHFAYYYKQRDKNSVQRWLESEGYLVGNHLSEDMKCYTKDVLKKALLAINDTEGEYSFVVKSVSEFGDLFNIEGVAKKGDHQAKRRWQIALISE